MRQKLTNHPDNKNSSYSKDQNCINSIIFLIKALQRNKRLITDEANGLELWKFRRHLNLTHVNQKKAARWIELYLYNVQNTIRNIFFYKICKIINCIYCCSGEHTVGGFKSDRWFFLHLNCSSARKNLYIILKFWWAFLGSIYRVFF